MATKSSPTQPVPISLISKHLEQWSATIERDNDPKTTDTNPDLFARFLSRFGLKDASLVIKYLTSESGNKTLNMIAKEIMEAEVKNRNIIKLSEEEKRRQQGLLLLFLSLIAKDKAKAKQATEIIQQQNEQLHEGKTESKKEKPIVMQMAVADNQAEELLKLDTEIKKLERELDEVEDELTSIEEEATAMEDRHGLIRDNLEDINILLRLPMTNNQPVPHDHIQQQVLVLTTHMNTLRAQSTPQTDIGTEDTSLQSTQSRLDRRIRMLEDRIGFLQSQLQDPPKTPEQIYEKLIEDLTSKIGTTESIEEYIPSPTLTDEEDLRLQRHAFLQALQFIRKQKILLNSECQPVEDIEQAHFIIDPNHQTRFRRHGDSYLVLTEDMDMNKEQLSEQEWEKAKQNYFQLRPKICTVNSFYKELMKEESEDLMQRTQTCKRKAHNILDRINKVESQRSEMVQGKTPFSMAPKPQPQSSYSLMLKRLITPDAPAPSTKDIKEIHRELIKAAPDKKREIHALFNEIESGKPITPSFFKRLHQLVPQFAPQVEEDPKRKHKNW